MPTVSIVFDQEGSVYGVYEEYVDAEDRIEELVEESDGDMSYSDYLIEEYELNKDFNPE